MILLATPLFGLAVPNGLFLYWLLSNTTASRQLCTTSPLLRS